MVQVETLNKLLWAFGFADVTFSFVSSTELRAKVRDIEKGPSGEILVNRVWFRDADLPIIVRALLAIRGSQDISRGQLQEAIDATQKINLPSAIEQQVGAILFQLDASDELKVALGKLLTAAFNNVSMWSINMVSARATGKAMTVFDPVRAYMDPPGTVTSVKSSNELSDAEIREFDEVLDGIDEVEIPENEDDELHAFFPRLHKVDADYRGWSVRMADILVSKKEVVANVNRWFDEKSTIWGGFLVEITDVAHQLCDLHESWITAFFDYVTELVGNQLEHAIRDTYDAYESRTAVNSLMPDDPIKCSSIRAALDRVMSYGAISKLRPPLDEHIKRERDRGYKRFVEAYVTVGLDIRNAFTKAILEHDPKSK